jgi:hypothetical protein
MCCHRFATTKQGNSPLSLTLQATVRNGPIIRPISEWIGSGGACLQIRPPPVAFLTHFGAPSQAVADRDACHGENLGGELHLRGG